MDRRRRREPRGDRPARAPRPPRGPRPPASGVARGGTLRRGRRPAALLAIVLAALVLACAAPPPPPFHVLLVVLDTLRADRCSFLGYGRPTTPRIEEFARDAVSFEDAWSPASWTAPAHAALFTGRAPHRLDLFRGLDTNLRGSETLAERLAAAGWDTGLFSSNPWVGPDSGLARGFATVRHRLPGDHGYTKSDLVVDEALAWIRHRETPQGTPFLACVNLMDAHAPYDPPEVRAVAFVRPGIPREVVAEARRMNGPRGLLAASLNAMVLPPALDAAASDLYDAGVATADAEIGRLLDALAADGVLGRTVVVVTSDHGEGLGDHGWREHGLRLHRELLRVPLVVRVPGRLDGGRRVAAVVGLADVFPTVLRACGLVPAPGLDARDLAEPGPPRPAFASDRPYAGWPMLAEASIPAHWRTQLETVRRSVYDGRHHLVVDDRGGVELHDVAADPGELRNLAGEDPATVARLRALLEAEFGRR